MNKLLTSVMNMARESAPKFGLKPTAAQPHQLVLLSELKSGKDSYIFPFDNSEQQQIARDFAIGLNDKDAYFFGSAALFLLSVPVIDGKECFAAAVPVSFPDPRIFTGAAVDANSLSEVQQLNSCYAARLGLTTNNELRLEDFFTRPFRKIHTTQSSAVTQNEQHGCEFVEFGTVYNVFGFEKNFFRLNLNIPDVSQLGGTAERKTYAMMVTDGSVLKSATTGAFTKQG